MLFTLRGYEWSWAHLLHTHNLDRAIKVTLGEKQWNAFSLRL